MPRDGALPIRYASKGEIAPAEPEWKSWDRRSLLKQVERSITNGAEVKPSVMEKMAGIAEKIATESEFERNQALGIKILIALDRLGLDRAKLALDAMKLSTLEMLTQPSEGQSGTLEVEVTKIRTRLTHLQSNTLGRPLFPGAQDFVVDVKPEGVDD